MEWITSPIAVPYNEYVLAFLRMLATVQIILATVRNLKHRGHHLLTSGLTVYCLGMIVVAVRGSVVSEPLMLHTLLLNTGLIMLAHELSRVKRVHCG